MKFNFTLQAVLEQRLAQEERMQRDYSQTVARIAALRRGLAEIQSDIEHWRGQIRADQTSMGWERRGIYENWIEARQEEAAQLAAQIERMTAIAERERMMLIKAMQARMLIEKLREREHQLFCQERDRVEAREFDEFGVRQFSQQLRAQERDEPEIFATRSAATTPAKSEGTAQ